MDKIFMQAAIEEAIVAMSTNEVPVGAVIVRDGHIIARAHNEKETQKNALAHAEILAIERACNVLGSWRLNDVTIYVTLEPCPMCAGAMIQARVARCVFGAYDPKSGAAGSVCNITNHPILNHRLDVVGGVLQSECAGLLSEFFETKRRD